VKSKEDSTVNYYILKIAITVLLIMAISEVSKKSSLIAAILASLPVISLIAMIWLYIDTKDIEKVSILSTQIAWMVLPSLVFFISLPILLKNGFQFYLSLFVSMALTAVSYFLLLFALKQVGLKL